MTVLFICVVCCIVIFVSLAVKYVEDLVNYVLGRHRKHHERISTLEVNDVTQDIRIHDQSEAIKEQGHHLLLVKNEVRELGNDIGWADSERNTEAFPLADIHERETPVAPPPDDEPPEAA